MGVVYQNILYYCLTPHKGNHFFNVPLEGKEMQEYKSVILFGR